MPDYKVKPRETIVRVAEAPPPPITAITTFEDTVLWGIVCAGRWWVDDSGIVFHTTYEIIARIQADILSRTSDAIHFEAKRFNEVSQTLI